MRPAMRGGATWIAAAVTFALAACSAGAGQGPAGPTAPSAASPVPSAAASIAASSPRASVEPTANPAKVVDGAPYRPHLDLAGFTTAVSNPYMPLTPGTVWTYEGDGERVETYVTHQTETVMGIETIVVRDRAFEDYALVEDTLDWFAQDAEGNVWYFGEDTAECEDGKIASRHGAWEAGVDGAQPGVVMLAEPAVGEYYRQEFLRGEAEDVARVLDVDATVKSGSETYRDAVVTEDFTALEPGHVEHKIYAPEIGLVESRFVKGGTGVERLVETQTDVPASSMPAGKLCQG